MFRALAVSVALTASVTAQCSSASCFASPGTDPVIIFGPWQIASGAVLDFGQRHVILATGGSLFLNGPASILAAKVTAQAGSFIDGRAVAASDLSITTVAANGHDGTATFDGTIDLSGWPPGSTWGHDAGHFTLTAGGAATVTQLDTTGGTSAIVGSVTITAPSITVGTIVANMNDYYGTASIIHLTSTGPVVVGSIQGLTTEYSGNTQVHIVGSSYTQVTDIVAAPYSGGGGYPGWISVNVTGDAAINGVMRTNYPGQVAGGTISVTAGGALTWVNAVADASGSSGGSISLTSQQSDVVVQGMLLARAENAYAWGNNGGYISVHAAGNVDITGTVDVATDMVQLGQNLAFATLIAGKQLTIHSGSLIDGRDPTGGCAGIGADIQLNGCQVVIESGASVLMCGSNPANWTWITAAIGDSMSMNGIISAGAPPNAIQVTSRRPWGYAFSGSGTFTPAPTIIIAPGMPPCMGDLTTVTATTPVTAGQTVTVSVSSLPNKPLLVAANTALVHLSLDALGWTQVNPFTAFLLADHLGILGSPIAGTTDPAGQWSWSVATPVTPVLSNVDVFFDVYVIDPSAPNGLFRQPPFATTHFN